MIRQKIKDLINYPDAVIERPENKNFGDYSTNVALKLAKKEKKNPMDLAKEIAEKLASSQDAIFAKIEAVPPGFINFTLSNGYLQKQISEILAGKEQYRKINVGQGQKVQVEFISANPTGPLTLGNGRGGFFGDVLANVLATVGYKVKREYFINDAGYQIEILGYSVLKDSKAQYRGDYIDRLHKKFICWFCTKDPKKVGKKAADCIIKKIIQPTIEDKMKIRFDAWTSENELRQSGKKDKVLELLKEKNLTYGQDGAVWFKSTQFGDDKDRVLITSTKEDREQSATYLLPDAAYHYKKFVEDKFDKVIDIWGADHHGYVARLQAAGKALGVWDESNLKIIIMQLVRLFEGGKEVKMSKRAGTYITLDELLDEIPLDVARWFFLMRSPDTHMDFDLDLAKEQSEKNPVYYVQYAYARLCAIMRKAGKSRSTNYKLQTPNFKLLEHRAELDLIKQLIRLPEVVEDTAKDYQVHRLPQYALDLVRAFHKFYEECRVLPALNRAEGSGLGSDKSDDINEATSQARLGLCEATKIVLKNTLDLMGISAPEKM